MAGLLDRRSGVDVVEDELILLALEDEDEAVEEEDWDEEDWDEDEDWEDEEEWDEVEVDEEET